LILSPPCVAISSLFWEFHCN